MNHCIPRVSVATRLIIVAAFLATSQSLSAQQLAYQWKAGAKFSYDMKVVVESDSETITYQGVVHYTVDSANNAQAKLTYRGGLRESKTTKRQRNPGRFGPFGPRGFPNIPSPFSRPAFAGKTQTTNKITLSTRGAALAMQGESQLPYLLGNVSLLPFEPLPDQEQRQWEVDSGISITEKEEHRGPPFGPFGPMSPFSSRSRNENVQAASEVSNFTIERRQGNLVIVAKKYRLKTPQTPDNPAFDMQGEGTWTFDTKDNVPHAYDMAFTLNIKDGNTTTSVPITVTYTRLTAEKLAEMEAAAKKKAEELAKAAAEKKALAEAPLTPQETTEVLRVLSSRDKAGIKTTLDQLAGKSLSDPDPKIVAAIERHLASFDKATASSAHNAMTKWSPEYAQRKRLEKEYQGPSPVKSTDLYVESITPLYVGQIVQAQRPGRGSFWRAARVKQLLSDGHVELAFLSRGEENSRDTVPVPRRNIQLAPPELDQPARPRRGSRAAYGNTARTTTPTAATTGSARTWTDRTGRYRVEATFIDVTDGKVNLRRSDGRNMAIPLDKLSDSDRSHVEKLQEEADNPFQLVD